MQPSSIMFHWTSCIGFIQSLFLAYVHPPTLLRVVYTGTTLANMYHYGLSAQLHEPSRQTMRLYIPDDEHRMIILSQVAKWTSRTMHMLVVIMDTSYIVIVTDYNVWLTMMMIIAIGLYPALKLMRRCAPDINTRIAQSMLHSRNHGTNPPHNTPVHADYSLLDDRDHRDAVQQRFMLKQVPRMLAMIALSACHMALMLDVRDTCINIVSTNSTILWDWMCI